jgi:cell division protease FtsH
VNEAALMAARAGRSVVTAFDFDMARDKVMMGPERRSMVMSDAEKEMTAYHEAGHALLALKMPKHDPIHKATIIPRGQALGMVQALPEQDRLSWHKDEMEQRIAMAMAGKAAEIVKYGEDSVSGGALSDIQQASQMARMMVMRLGMSEKVGNIDYAEAAEGYSGNTGGFSVSTPTKEIIESEVKRIIDDGFNLAMKTIKDCHDEFERIAQGLLEFETLSGEEIKRVMRGEPPHANDDDEGGSAEEEAKPSVAAVPKTKPRRRPSGDAGLEPSA